MLSQYRKEDLSMGRCNHTYLLDSIKLHQVIRPFNLPRKLCVSWLSPFHQANYDAILIFLHVLYEVKVKQR